MAYQNSAVTGSTLILGNYKIETATVGTSVGGTWVNLGAGIVNSFAHNQERYAVQAGNAPDPLEGIARETFTIDGELIQYNSTNLALLSSGGVTSAAGGSGVTVLSGGGNQTLTPVAFKLTNTRLIGSVTQSTVIMVFSGVADSGPSFTAKSDNDADPINVMPFSITAKPLSTLSAGAQLYTITHTYNA